VIATVAGPNRCHGRRRIRHPARLSFVGVLDRQPRRITQLSLADQREAAFLSHAHRSQVVTRVRHRPGERALCGLELPRLEHQRAGDHPHTSPGGLCRRLDAAGRTADQRVSVAQQQREHGRHISEPAIPELADQPSRPGADPCEGRFLIWLICCGLLQRAPHRLPPCPCSGGGHGRIGLRKSRCPHAQHHGEPVNRFQPYATVRALLQLRHQRDRHARLAGKLPLG
jgi:hypothetical protein